MCFTYVVYLNFSASAYSQYEDINKSLCISLVLDKPAIFDIMTVSIIEKSGSATGKVYSLLCTALLEIIAQIIYNIILCGILKVVTRSFSTKQ